MYSKENQIRYAQNAEEHDQIQLNSTLYLAYRDLPKLLKENFNPLKNTIRLLDFGCGTGTSTQLVRNMLIKNGYKVNIIGMDLSQENLQIAKQKIPEGTFYHLKSNEQKPMIQNVDIVLLFFVSVENNSVNLEEIFKYLHQQLNPNGLLVHVNPSAKVYDGHRKWYSINTDFETNKRSNNENSKPKYQEDQTVTLSIKDTKSQATFTFTDFFHSGKFYYQLYKATGFNPVAAHKPLGNSDDDIMWQDEKQASPYKIHIIKKLAISPIEVGREKLTTSCRL